MAKLFYSAITSVDGYIEDADGHFGWGEPDEEVLLFLNDHERPIGTYLYGRRMYETMAYWETAHELDDPSPASRDFTELWRAADKIVFSRSLEVVSSARTRIVADFDAGMVGALKASSAHDLSVGGAELAGEAIRAGLVDEVSLYVMPVVVGGGKPALPAGVRSAWELLDTHRFAGGCVFLRYRVG